MKKIEMQNSAKSESGMTFIIEKNVVWFFNLIRYYFHVISLVKDTKVVRNF